MSPNEIFNYSAGRHYQACLILCDRWRVYLPRLLILPRNDLILKAVLFFNLLIQRQHPQDDQYLFR